MTKSVVLSLGVVFALVVAILPVSAHSPSVRDRQTALVRSYVAALQSKNAAGALKLLHPGIRACMGSKRAFFDYIVDQQMTGFPSGHYTDLTITPVAPKSTPALWTFAPAKDFPYPVKPTYDIQIKYNRNQADLFIDLIEVAPSGASWYWVTACPSADGMRFMQKMQDQAARQNAKVKKLVSELRDPLLSQIKKLLADHDTVGAIKAYQKATGADATTAALVIDAIQNPKNN